MVSVVSTVSCAILTPFILLAVSGLASLAIITSTITSSFIFLRLFLLAVEMISGLTLESTNWLLTSCMENIRHFVYKNSQSKTSKSTIKKRKLPSSSLSLSQLPFKAPIKSTYSVSVPGTPDPYSCNYEFGI